MKSQSLIYLFEEERMHSGHAIYCKCNTSFRSTYSFIRFLQIRLICHSQGYSCSCRTGVAQEHYRSFCETAQIK